MAGDCKSSPVQAPPALSKAKTLCSLSLYQRQREEEAGSRQQQKQKHIKVLCAYHKWHLFVSFAKCTTNVDWLQSGSDDGLPANLDGRLTFWLPLLLLSFRAAHVSLKACLYYGWLWPVIFVGKYNKRDCLMFSVMKDHKDDDDDDAVHYYNDVWKILINKSSLICRKISSDHLKEQCSRYKNRFLCAITIGKKAVL